MTEPDAERTSHPSAGPAGPAGPAGGSGTVHGPEPTRTSSAAPPSGSSGSPGASDRPLPGARIEQAIAGALHRITGSALGPYQTAVVRIGFAFVWLAFLLRELPHRHELYGPNSPWSWELGSRLIDGNGAFTVLMWSRSDTWFEIVYALAIAASLGLLLGWRTRTMSVLFMIGVLSLQNRSVFMGDGGDNVIHLMAIYLVLTRCGQVWSLDARRARRAGRGPLPRSGPEDDDGDRVPDGAPERDTTGVVLWTALGGTLAVLQLLGFADLPWFDRGPVPEIGWFPGLGWATVLWGIWLAHGVRWVIRRHAPGEPRTLLDVLGNLTHNTALLIIMVEVCLIYSTAGWYKIQGSRWQDGTAVYYPMQLDYFAPWPALSDALAGSPLMILLLSYGTVLVQVAFPFTLFNRRVKNVLLALMMLEHASIAVVLGLPFFSLAMIAADAVFLPTVFLVWLGDRVGRFATRLGPPGDRDHGAAGNDRDPAAPDRAASTGARPPDTVDETRAPVG